MSDMTHFQSFSNRNQLASYLAKEVAEDLRQGINLHGAASLVVSGGSTPKPFFEALKQEALPWEKVWITLADERWVDADHPDSNEKLVRESLLPEGAHFVGLKNSAATPAEGAAEASNAVENMPHPFDVVVLGMGDDGHTASLFPKAPELADAIAPDAPMAMGITPPSYAPHPRITLSLSTLLNTRRLVVHITGEAKQKIFEHACDPGTTVEDLPIRAVLCQDAIPVEVYWAA